MKKKLYPIVIFVFLVSIWFDVTLEASKKVAVESIEVITTIPIETSLGHADTKQALDTWVEMINSSVKTIDLAQFYMATKENEPLETVIHQSRRPGD